MNNSTTNQKKVTRFIFSSFLTNVVIGASGFLLSIIFARALGPAGKGYITAIILWPTVLASVFSFGYAHSNIYHAADSRISASKLLTNSFLIFFAVAPLAFIAGWLGLPIFLKNAGSNLFIAGKVGLIAIPILLLQNFVYGLLRGWHKIDHFNFLRTIEKVVLLLLLIGLILVHKISLIIFTVAWISMCSLTTLIAVLFIYKNKEVKFKSDRKILVQTVKYGLKSYGGSLSEWGTLRLDQLMIAALFAASSLGIYSVAVTMTESIWLLAFAFSMVIFPATSALSQSDALKLTAKASRVTLFLLSGLAIIVFLLSDNLVSFIFGPKFAQAAFLVKILLPGGIAFGVGRVISSGLMGINQPLKASIAQVIAFVSTLLFAPPLIIYFGVIGAAIASDITYGMYLLVIIYYFLKNSDLSLKDMLIVKRADLDTFQKILEVPRTKTL